MTPLMMSLLSAVVLSAVVAQASADAANSTPARTPTAELRIDSGVIRGLVLGDKKDIHVYKGIPYAAPCVGERRWTAPQPVSPWKGVRDCFEFGAACPQQMPALFAAMPALKLNAPQSEDCLFLNVWTPADRPTAKLPVLYWIHGGGYVMGAASQPLYDGEELARLGCVVVSVNYRLGSFGFLAHPTLSQENSAKASGNYGIYDQIEGLRWVARNIADFGGDPKRVAIFGESAGGGSVVCLMASPLAKGLFRGAIAQSPPAGDLLRLRDPADGHESAEAAGKEFMARCGLAEPLDAGRLRQLKAEILLKGLRSEPGVGTLTLKRLPLPIGPVVDGVLLLADPNQVFTAGREQPVPLIVGNTREEMSIFLMATKMPTGEDDYQAKLREAFGDGAAAIAKAYPGKDPKQIRSSVTRLLSDLTFVSESRHLARTHAAAGQKIYRYEFARGTKAPLFEKLGAHHGAELAFLFQRPALKDDQAERRASSAMGRYWINFAATGNPNGPGLPPWPAYHPEAQEMIEFADDVNVLKRYREDELETLEKCLRAGR
jgi:para-nitrobenzyl esterase